MKKLLHPKNLPMNVTCVGLVGFLLHLWALGSGPDTEGLYALAAFPWILLLIVTVAVPFAIIYLTRPLGEPLKYTLNFPASVVSAVGTLLGALAIALAGIRSFSETPDALGVVTGVLGIAGGVCLLFVAYARLRGGKVNFLYHLIACIFLALRTFNQCKLWSNQPQITPFLFYFMAQICAMLAVYQLCAFDVDLGKRRTSLFWSLMTVYLCLVALPATKDVLFCGCIAIWMLTNLCSLRPVKKRRPAPQEPEQTVQAPQISTDVSVEEMLSWVEEDNG